MTLKITHPNRRKHSPIPGLADHIAHFNRKRELKAELAAIRAAFADRVYAASYRPKIKHQTSKIIPCLTRTAYHTRKRRDSK